MKYKKKAIPQRIRCAVSLRDKGICQNCGKKGVLFYGNTTHCQVFEREKLWGRKLSFETGHILPESLGGEAVMENLVLLCRECNRRLGAHTFLSQEEQLYYKNT